MRNAMSVVDDTTTFGRARLSFADQAEIDDFVAMLGRFERGEISPRSKRPSMATKSSISAWSAKERRARPNVVVSSTTDIAFLISHGRRRLFGVAGAGVAD